MIGQRTMELPRGHRAKELNKTNHLQNGGSRIPSDAILVIKLPDPQIMRIMSRSIFLALVILTLPCIVSILRGFNSISTVSVSAKGLASNLLDFEFTDFLLQDLAKEGIVKKGDKALIITPGVGALIDGLDFLHSSKFDLVFVADLEQAVSFPNGTFDFAFAFRFEDIKFVDCLVKVGGLVVTQLSNGVSDHFQKESNYRVVYLRQFDSTIVAMRKMDLVNKPVDFSAKRRLSDLALEVKRAALKGLEDVLLEPPVKALAKSKTLLKKFNYLPDLLGDSLEYYPRRIFINVGLWEERRDVMEWFNQNYPSRNQEFELYNIQMALEGLSIKKVPPDDVSDWLMKNVKEEEFVVMKAGAEVAEKMIETGTIHLVDELFLECQNHWQNGERVKRAYWECIALYGRLRDEGVAVHQWWD